MKNLCFKLCTIVFALLIAVSAAACENNNKKSESVQTYDTASRIEEPVEEPDIGEHKDYDKEPAECYDSYGILIAEQDGTKRGMELFDTGSGYAEFYGNELNEIKDRLGTKVNVYSMIVPTACELYCPSNKRQDIESQEEVMEYVRDMLVNVKEVDVLTTLRNHNAENIYFRTDNRWTGLGAYYAGKAFAKQAGVEYADISEYTEKIISSEYVGNLSDSVDDKGQADLDEHPDTFVYYEPKARFKTHYYDEEFEYLTDGAFFEEVPERLYDSYFKGGYYCLKLTSGVKNGRKLIIVKDDFGTALAPFMTGSFEEVYVVDVEYLEANLVEMIQEFGITDVLYVMNTFSVTGSRVYTLETLRTQATHGTLKDDAPEDTDYDSSTDSDGKNKSSDSDTDTEAESETEYVYDIGINNPVGVIVDSEVIDLEEYNNNYESYNSYEEEEYEDNTYADDDEEYYYDDEEYY